MGVLFFKFQEKKFAQCMNFFCARFHLCGFVNFNSVGHQSCSTSQSFWMGQSKKFTHSKREEIGINK